MSSVFQANTHDRMKVSSAIRIICITSTCHIEDEQILPLLINLINQNQNKRPFVQKSKKLRLKIPRN